MGNAVTLVAKRDHIVWTVFGAFWAANAVLLVALFQNGDFPSGPWDLSCHALALHSLRYGC